MLGPHARWVAGSESQTHGPSERLTAATLDVAADGKKIVAFLKPGPNRDQPPDEAKALMAGHLANIERMADEGSLVLAGPFLDDGPYAGIYVFAVKTVEEAAALTATDPAIKAGRLEMELHPWYGSAALGELTPLHRRIQRTSLTDAK